MLQLLHFQSPGQAHTTQQAQGGRQADRQTGCRHLATDSTSAQTAKRRYRAAVTELTSHTHSRTHTHTHMHAHRPPTRSVADTSLGKAIC
jgi:hypothetical protein